MTIPTLIANYQKKALKTQFTHTYSLLNQALGLMKANNQMPSLYDYYVRYESGKGFYRRNEFVNEFRKYVKQTSLSDEKLPVYYTYDGSKKYSADNENYSLAKPDFVLANGAYIYVGIAQSIEADYCIFFTIDINGAKGPNRLGYDYFNFYINDSKDVLKGRKMSHLYAEDEWKEDEFSGAAGYPCSVNSTQSANGIGCAWYALQDVCPDDDTKGYWECLPR